MPITLSVPHSRGILRLALLGLLALPLACPQTDPTNEDGGADGTVVDGAPAGEWVAAPHIDAISPTTQAGGQAFTLTVNGSGLGGGAEILLADTPLKTDPISSTQLKAAVAPQKRGALAVTVRRGIATSNAVTLTITNTPPTIAAVGDQSVDEDKALLVKLQVTDLDGDTPRVFVSGQPPGAAFDARRRPAGLADDLVAEPPDAVDDAADRRQQLRARRASGQQRGQRDQSRFPYRPPKSRFHNVTMSHPLIPPMLLPCIFLLARGLNVRGGPFTP